MARKSKTEIPNWLTGITVGIGLIGLLLAVMALFLPTDFLQNFFDGAVADNSIVQSWGVRNLALASIVLFAAASKKVEYLVIVYLAKIVNETGDIVVGYFAENIAMIIIGSALLFVEFVILSVLLPQVQK